VGFIKPVTNTIHTPSSSPNLEPTSTFVPALTDDLDLKDIHPQGSSRATGGILCGRAAASYYSPADEENTMFNAIGPTKLIVKIFTSDLDPLNLKHNKMVPSSKVTIKMDPYLGPILENISQRYPAIKGICCFKDIICFFKYKLDVPMILIYNVNNGIWESKGNFQIAKEDNNDITIPPTDDGKFNLDILCVSLPFIYIILSGLKFYSLSSMPQSLYLPSPQLSITARFHFKQIPFPLLLVLVLRLLLLPQTLVRNPSLPLLQKSRLLLGSLSRLMSLNLSRNLISL
jgi:hypothetical protein